MNGFFDFLVYYTLYLSICAVLYRLIIQGKFQPSMCRRVIIDILCFSILVVPMCKIVYVTELNLTPAQKIENLLLLIYGSGVVLFSNILAVNFIRLEKIKKRSTPLSLEGKKVFLHKDSRLGCFSWYRYIFLPENIKERNKEEQRIVLTHENAHLYLFHWIDLIGMNIFLIFQWFNPFMWYLRKELRQIHEYEADRRVLEFGKVEKRTYEIFLVDESSRKQSDGLTSGLSFSSLKYRIIMMNKDEFKKEIVEHSGIIYALAAAIICLL